MPSKAVGLRAGEPGDAGVDGIGSNHGSGADGHRADAEILEHGPPDAPRGLRGVDADGERLPVHWRYDDSEAAYVIRYLSVQDGRPIRHPLPAGLANAARQLAIGTRPVTLLLDSRKLF